MANGRLSDRFLISIDRRHALMHRKPAQRFYTSLPAMLDGSESIGDASMGTTLKQI